MPRLLAPGTRTALVRNLTLAGGAGITFGFHPIAAPLTVATTASGLELCPFDTTPFQWITGSFKDISCQPLEGSITVPGDSRRVGDHIVVGIRNRTTTATTVESITFTYDAADRWFFVAFSALAPGAKSPAVAITPSQDRIIGAAVYLAEFRKAPFQAVVAQRGIALAPSSERYEHDGDPYGPAALDETVVIHTTNDTTSDIDVYVLFITWS